MSKVSLFDKNEFYKEMRKRRNPFSFLDELHKTLEKLENEAKNLRLLYDRDVNIPDVPRDVSFETPFMTYLKIKELSKVSGLGKVDLVEAVESSNPGLKLEELTEKLDEKKKETFKKSLETAKGKQLSYLYSLEIYKLKQMKIIGWSVILNAFYIMDWASRVVSAASAAALMIQSFGDELYLPAGFTADLNKLVSIAMDVAGYVRAGMEGVYVWSYRAAKEYCGTVKKMHISDETKFIILDQKLYTLKDGRTVKFAPVDISKIPSDERENWRIPVWGVLATFIDNGSVIEWDEEKKKGDIVMFLYTCRSKVLTGKFEKTYYECWNHIKMVMKKVKLAMDLLQAKQRIISQLPPPPVEVVEEEEREEEETSEE